MQRKCDLTTNKINKYKARLNVHDGKQTYGAPVVTWFAICLMIIFGITFGWTLKQINFIMAYPQAPIECDLYMELPHGISAKGASAKDYALKLLANIYGQKQGGRVWNAYLTSKLVSELGFTQSKVNQCVFY
ncbi:hypothetical protein ACHAWF_000419 [Thalassiosira exigua]